MAAQPFDEFAKQFEEMADKLTAAVAPFIEQLEEEGEKLSAMAAPVMEHLERQAREVVHQQAERALGVMDVLREHLEKFVRTGGPESPLVD